MTTSQTKNGLVIGVNNDGATVLIDGRKQLVPWGTLRRAAKQDDAELRPIYAELLKQAEATAADGPVEVEVTQDETNVWWVVRVRAAFGGGPANWRRCVDEGCTLSNWKEAEWEANNICQRLGRRVERRIGF